MRAASARCRCAGAQAGRGPARAHQERRRLALQAAAALQRAHQAHHAAHPGHQRGGAAAAARALLVAALPPAQRRRRLRAGPRFFPLAPHARRTRAPCPPSDLILTSPQWLCVQVRFHNTGPQQVPGVVVMEVVSAAAGVAGSSTLEEPGARDGSDVRLVHDPKLHRVVVVFNASPLEQVRLARAAAAAAQQLPQAVGDVTAYRVHLWARDAGGPLPCGGEPPAPAPAAEQPRRARRPRPRQPRRRQLAPAERARAHHRRVRAALEPLGMDMRCCARQRGTSDWARGGTKHALHAHRLPAPCTREIDLLRLNSPVRSICKLGSSPSTGLNSSPFEFK